MHSFFGRVGVLSFVVGFVACSSSTPNGGTPDASTGDAPVTDAPVTDAPHPTDVRPPADGGTPTPAAVLSFGGDMQRTAANRNETHLTPAALRAGGFGLDPGFAPQFDGALYSQPLYVGG